MAQIWSELLEIPVEKVGVNTSFFDLGGHSLLITKLISRLQDEFNQTISIQRLFSLQTIREIAGELEMIQLKEQAKNKLNKSQSILEMEI
ncbi:Linear gramicidin synthase subunit B [Pseudoalteromonas sp. P1-9]|nr:Linear gramicidin synthase subunit B [Pseudoalteromonas sp. P1-9]